MMIAALNAQQERARKQRKTLFNKQAVNGATRVKTAAKRDVDASRPGAAGVKFTNVKETNNRSKGNELTTSLSEIPEFVPDDPTVELFASNDERWQYLAASLLRRYQEPNKSVSTFPQSIVPFFKEVQLLSGVVLTAQERKCYYNSFFRRASAAGVLQSTDAEELLSSSEFEFNVTRQEVALMLNEKLQGRNVMLDSNQGAYIDCDNDNLNFEFFISLACDLKRRKQLVQEKESARTMSSLSRILPLDPESTPKQCWDFFCTLLLLYCSFSVPYGIAFIDSSAGDSMSVMDAFALGVDITFLIDICITFVTAVEVDGYYVRDLRAIAGHYSRTWLAADFAGSFPFDNVIATAIESRGTVSSTNFIRVLRFVRMLKLIRAVRFVSRLNKLKHRDGLEVLAPIIGICTSVFILIFTAHLLGCFFTMLLSIEDGDTNWLTHYNPALHDADAQTRYIVALYWAMISVTTMGYGDVVPVTHTERIFGIAVALVGAVVFSFCMGNVASLISQVPPLASVPGSPFPKFIAVSQVHPRSLCRLSPCLLVSLVQPPVSGTSISLGGDAPPPPRPTCLSILKSRPLSALVSSLPPSHHRSALFLLLLPPHPPTPPSMPRPPPVPSFETPAHPTTEQATNPLTPLPARPRCRVSGGRRGRPLPGALPHSGGVPHVPRGVPGGSCEHARSHTWAGAGWRGMSTDACLVEPSHRKIRRNWTNPGWRESKGQSCSSQREGCPARRHLYPPFPPPPLSLSIYPYIYLARPPARRPPAAPHTLRFAVLASFHPTSYAQKMPP